VWLIFLVAPLSDLFDRHPEPLPRAAGLVLIGGFVVLYLLTVGLPFRRTGEGGRPWLGPLVMFVLSVGVILLAGESGLNTWVFLAVACHAALRMWWAIAATAALVVLSVVLLIVVPGWNDEGGYPFSILAASMAMFGVVRMAERNGAMRASQREQARVAVLEERERFGRDLHDILGHSLTVIAVKSELAGRLVERDPVGARAEIADIERLTREALADVRSTVAGVREVTLVSELSAARTALIAAGIEPDLPGAVDEVPGELREVFGFVVREAVTNVVRHSGATRCTVRVEPTSVEVSDDGRGAGTPEPPVGSGLDGLRRRVEAAGLRFRAGPAVGGGFQVAARLGGPPQGGAVAAAEPGRASPRRARPAASSPPREPRPAAT
jgi:two-component system sensor histidine kinase DesK